MRRERGQATVEWVALVALVAGALAVAGAVVDVPWFPRALRCALLARCQGEDAELGAAYGDEVAALVRRHAPAIAYEPGTLTLPIDFRACRAHPCADAPDRRGLEVSLATRSGLQATAFTHVVDRRARGGDLFIQYWLYYPDSTYSGAASRLAAGAGAIGLGATPVGRALRAASGRHGDDWESYQVRVGPDGAVRARASAHHGYAGRKRAVNLNEAPDLAVAGVRLHARTGAWTAATGWTMVSRGSHAGHLVPRARGERRTAPDGLRLVPIEGLSAEARATRFAVVPPWRKPVYAEPEATGT